MTNRAWILFAVLIGVSAMYVDLTAKLPETDCPTCSPHPCVIDLMGKF